MKKLSNTEAELKKNALLIKKACSLLRLNLQLLYTGILFEAYLSQCESRKMYDKISGETVITCYALKYWILSNSNFWNSSGSSPMLMFTFKANLEWYREFEKS